MLSINKKNNHQGEESFHDQWARSVSLSEIDVIGQFEKETTPEYSYAISMLGNFVGKRVLNLGCGIGEEAVYLAIKGANVVAIDISEGMLINTQRLACLYGVDKKIKYIQMSAEELIFSDNSFDLVLGCNILHHVNIEKTIVEVKKILKPKGIAVFVEPLIYNPIINVYRAIADKVRTDYEHPISYKDFLNIKKHFSSFHNKEFHLFTLLIFLWFFLGERIHPNKVRYWKKIIIQADKYKGIFKLLNKLDETILMHFPFVRKYCWITVIKLQKI